jgi:hypothetical protein
MLRSGAQVGLAAHQIQLSHRAKEIADARQISPWLSCNKFHELCATQRLPLNDRARRCIGLWRLDAIAANGYYRRPGGCRASPRVECFGDCVAAGKGGELSRYTDQPIFN